MQYVLIVFSSSTMANRIRKLAMQEGLRDLRVIQTPKSLSAGCSYALRCPASSIDAVRAVADEYGADARRVYAEYQGEGGIRTYEAL